MQVLVVQNFEHTSLGQVATALEEAGATIDMRKPYQGAALPTDSSNHDALIVLGGGQNARDDENHPYLPEVVELIRSFEQADRSVLGICLGGQLVARAFGADNLIGAAPEFGWKQVVLTGRAKSDTVFAAMPSDLKTFQFHNDTFTLPEGAVHLASSDVAAHQAFRVGRATYGVQFHFEADRKLLADWNERFTDFIEQTEPGWIAKFEQEADIHAEEADRNGIALARAWVSTIKRR